MSRLSKFGASLLNFMSVAGPVICIIHCLAAPVVLAVLPFLNIGHCHDSNENWLTAAIIGICLLAIVPSYFKHRNLSVIWLMLAGFVFVIAGAFAEEKLGTIGHSVASVLGSICLITASLRNRSYLKEAGKMSCCTHGHEKHGEQEEYGNTVTPVSLTTPSPTKQE